MKRLFRGFISVAIIAAAGCEAPVPPSSAPQAPDAAMEVFFVQWDVLTRMRYLRDDLTRATGNTAHVCLSDRQAAEAMLALIGNPATWDGQNAESEMDLRLLARVETARNGADVFYADRFRICAESNGACRDLTDEDRAGVERLVENLASDGNYSCS